MVRVFQILPENHVTSCLTGIFISRRKMKRRKWIYCICSIHCCDTLQMWRETVHICQEKTCTNKLIFSSYLQDFASPCVHKYVQGVGVCSSVSKCTAYLPRVTHEDVCGSIILLMVPLSRPDFRVSRICRCYLSNFCALEHPETCHTPPSARKDLMGNLIFVLYTCTFYTCEEKSVNILFRQTFCVTSD